jgi:hypothetical protein
VTDDVSTPHKESAEVEPTLFTGRSVLAHHAFGRSVLPREIARVAICQAFAPNITSVRNQPDATRCFQCCGCSGVSGRRDRCSGSGSGGSDRACGYSRCNK